jgi:amidase
MTISNGLAMSWEEWHRQDAVALADLVRAGKVTPQEICAQAAEAAARMDPQIEAVLGLYEDVLASPDKDGPSQEGRLYGVPMLLKDLGSGLAGRTQESGSKLFKGTSSRRPIRLSRIISAPDWSRSEDRRHPNSA